jgi:hypothetical protein
MRHDRPVDWLAVLFVISAFVAALELRPTAVNITVYDLVILTLAFLVIVTRQTVYLVPTSTRFAVGLLALMALVGTFRSTHPLESLTQLVQLVYIFLLQAPLVMTLAHSKLTMRWSIVALAAGWIVVWAKAHAAGAVNLAGRAVPAEGGSPNHLGYPVAYLLPLVLWVLFEILRERQLRFSSVLILAGIPFVVYFGLWAVMAGGSRSAALSAVVALVTFLVVRTRREKIGTSLGLNLLLLIGVATIAYTLYSGGFLPAVLEHRVQATMQGNHSLSDDRLHLALGGLRAFLASPLVGVGLQNFRYVSVQYWFLASAQDPHNIWIQFLATTGLFGTLAFAWVILGWYWWLLRARWRAVEHSDRDLLSALIAAFTGVMVQNLFMPLMIHRHAWLIYGLGLAAAVHFGSRRRGLARPTLAADPVVPGRLLGAQGLPTGGGR